MFANLSFERDLALILFSGHQRAEVQLLETIFDMNRPILSAGYVLPIMSAALPGVK
jgi:hypothetical protein